METKKRDWEYWTVQVKSVFNHFQDMEVSMGDEEIRIRWTNDRMCWTHTFFIVLLIFCRTYNMTFHVDEDGVAIYFPY